MEANPIHPLKLLHLFFRWPAWLLCLAGSFSLLRADSVTDWNAVALTAIRAERTAPPVAARNLAILHVAIFDAVNGIARTREPYQVTAQASGVTSVDAAIAAAGHRVLLALHPASSATIEAAYQASLAKLPVNPKPARVNGIAWGESVADAILQSRATDGANAVVTYVPGSGPGAWVPTLPAFAPALLPQWGGVTPFAMTHGAQFRPTLPPGLASSQWATEFNITKDLGRRDSTLRTADETEIALFWSNGAGTATPPGHWNVIAADLAREHGLPTAENARLFALLNIALADAGIAAWECKYVFNFWRPVTAIRAADTDGNAATSADAAWEPLLVTPPFPECVSGHSTFSGAAAVVLASYFGTDNVSFAATSEGLPGVTRRFSSFSSAADEAGMSRIYGGIHFMTANLEGLRSGGRLGGYVMENFLGPRQPPRHGAQ